MMRLNHVMLTKMPITRMSRSIPLVVNRVEKRKHSSPNKVVHHKSNSRIIQLPINMPTTFPSKYIDYQLYRNNISKLVRANYSTRCNCSGGCTCCIKNAFEELMDTSAFILGFTAVCGIAGIPVLLLFELLR